MHAFSHVFFHAISTHGDATERLDALHLLHEFVAGGVWQAEVAHKEVKRFAPRQSQRTGYIASRGDGETFLREERFQGSRGVRMVFHHEKAQSRRPHRLHSGGLVRCCDDRQWRGRHFDDKCCTAAGARAIRADAATMEFDERLGNGESKPKSPKLRRDAGVTLFKGIEDSRQHLRRNPRAIVGDADFDAGGRETLAGDMDTAIPRREFDRVLQHVPNHLLDA